MAVHGRLTHVPAENGNACLWPELHPELGEGGSAKRPAEIDLWPCRDVKQSLEKVALPSGLQRLTFGMDRNLSLDNGAPPSSLLSLTCGASFNQSFEKVALQSSLQSLTFGPDVHPELGEGVSAKWPAELDLWPVVQPER